VAPLALTAIGLGLLVVGFLTLRSFGPRYRVGRLLAAAPVITVAEAIAGADGPPRYIGIQGRIDADSPFEDDAHRPLVLRRATIERRVRGGWLTVERNVEAVDFGVREGLDSIAVDHASLDHGLVVQPRESVGTAVDLPDRLPAGLAPDVPVRLRLDLVSVVEHVIVTGVPRRVGPGGTPTLTAGLGRPLIMTTLERAEALQVLGRDGGARTVIAAVCLAGGAVMLSGALVLAVIEAATATVAAASPTASPLVGGDPRSSGSGPGLVGEPLIAIAAVVAIAIAAIVGTLIYLRVTGGRRA
jgi:hypothetical protein